MTKPKISNGNCLNPLGRVEKRFDEYKRCHEAASKNCNKMQESHNKSNDALKALLERKSKLSDSKSKKKRSTVTTAVNRKKPKLGQEQLQTVNKYFDNTVEVTPNVTLNAHTSEIPDIDWDNLDILNNSNFSIPINEHDLDGVLNNCYSQSIQPTDIKIQQNNSNATQLNTCKTSPNTKIDDLFTKNNVANFKTDEPIFPPPEQSNLPMFSQDPMKFEYLSPPNYHSSTATCNYNQTSNILPPTVNHVNQQSVTYNSHAAQMYSMNLPPVNPNNNNNSLSYQYHNPVVQEQMPVVNNSPYFYQYPSNYAPVNALKEPATNGVVAVDNFQLPTMSSGWYNSDVVQTAKPTNCKQTTIAAPHQLHQQQSQHFANNSVSIGNYRSNYPQYQQVTATAVQQAGSQVQYRQMFSNPTMLNSQSYEHHLSQAAISNYSMMPEQQQHAQYYYVDYPSSAIRADNIALQSNMSHTNNRSLVDQNDSRFLLSHQTNPILCRNIYQ